MLVVVRFIVASFLFSLFITSIASGQEHERARQLFVECRTAEDAGDLVKACLRCSESFDLVPSQATASALSRCEEGQGRVATALRRERAGLKLLRPTDKNYEARAAVAKKRIEELQARVPRLVFTWPKGQTVTVKIDNEPLDAGTGSFEVDAGAHEIVVSAVGHAPRRTSHTVAEREKLPIELMVGPPLTARKPSPEAVQSEPAGGDDQRIAAYVVGGVGILGVVGFAITGGLVLDKMNTVADECVEGVDGADGICRTQAGADAAAAGRTLNIINIVSLAVGIVGIGTGLALYLTADDSETVSIGVAKDFPGFELRGQF